MSSAHLAFTSFQLDREHSLYSKNNENCTSLTLTRQLSRGRSPYKEKKWAVPPPFRLRSMSVASIRSITKTEQQSAHMHSISLIAALFLLHCSLFYAQKKHETGFEPAALALARRCSTTEPLVHFLFRIYEVLHTFKTTYWIPSSYRQISLTRPSG